MHINDSIRAKYYDSTICDKSYIVLHYTANSGHNATARGNANYFHNCDRYASAHFTVDEREIYNCVPINMVAYAVGGNLYPATKGGAFYGKCINANSISIEMVSHTDDDGSYYIPQATIENALDLTKDLQKQFDIPNDHVIRHYDVNGKPCPWCWTTLNGYTEDAWNRFKGGLESAKPVDKKTLYRVQVGAFGSRYNADNYMEDIKSKGYPAFVTRASGLWKVQVGAFNVKENAYAYLDRIKGEGYPGFIVVV